MSEYYIGPMRGVKGYHVEAVVGDRVMLVDHGAVKEDAAAVVKEVYRCFPRRRIMFREPGKAAFTELVHEAGLLIDSLALREQTEVLRKENRNDTSGHERVSENNAKNRPSKPARKKAGAENKRGKRADNANARSPRAAKRNR